MSSKYEERSAAVLRDFMSLPQPEDKTIVSYVWLGSKKDTTKHKCRTLSFVPKTVDQVPDWAAGYRAPDAEGRPSTVESILKPVALYNDPFRRGNNKIVLCQMLNYDGTPVPFNSRSACAAVMDQVMEKHDPWFGIEQEYQLMDGSARGSWPLGWPSNGYPEFGIYEFAYSVGTNMAIGRDVCEAHYRACLYAGIPIAGVNSETTPGL
jgi:glutamine synthetase